MRKDRLTSMFDFCRSRVPLFASLMLSLPLSAQDQGRVERSFRLPYVTLVLACPAQAALDKLLADQQDPSSPAYHRWLTPEQFGDRFGRTPAEYAQVNAWLRSQGLRVENTARARNWIAFSGDAQHIEAALHTEIHRYRNGAETHFANATPVSLPRQLAGLVAGIRGLSDSWNQPRAPEYTNGSGTHTLSPADWSIIYDVAPLYAMGIDGTGQRIAVLGRSTTTQAYIDSFRSSFHLPPTTVEQHLIGPDPGFTNAANESSLDLEWSGAIAPGATLVYVYANNFNDAAQAAVDQNLAAVMTESFAICEPEGPPGLRAIAQQANAQGITWVAAAGDSGAADCDAHGFFGSTAGLIPAAGGLAVGIPASLPEVTAVGGTQFNDSTGTYWNPTNNANGGSAISYIPESVWNETGAGGLLAGGGGASIDFPKPAWQVAPGVPDDHARDVPDIAFSASGNHDGYMVVNSNGQRITGGTSAGAPSFAGVIALLNHYATSKGLLPQPGLGNVNPELYRLARTTTNVFHDISTGDNIVPCLSGTPDCTSGFLGFAAGPGYDLATGLGSLDVFNFVTQWSPAVTPTHTAVSLAPAGITVGDPVQVTATVSAASGTPTGTVSFTTRQLALGTVPLLNGAATMAIAGPRIPAGTTAISAIYSGDSAFSASAGAAPLSVTPSSTGSNVTVTISPNPAHSGQTVLVTLSEENGVATTITGWTINGVDNSYRFAADFGSNMLPAGGRLIASFPTAIVASFPAIRTYFFAGTDADGTPWTRQYTLTLVGPQTQQGLQVLAVPPTVSQNAAPESSCAWQQQVVVEEQDGLSVHLTRLLAGTTDLSAGLQQAFGSTRLAPFGTLQATICWPATTSTGTAQVQVEGIDELGEPLVATATAMLAAPVANPAKLAVSPAVAALSSSATQARLAVSASAPWTTTVFPPSKWLSLSGDSTSITLTVSAGSLPSGVYNATVAIQSPGSSPQLIEVPVVFTLGDTSQISIGGVTNAASYQQAAAPGMLLSVFGSGLAPSSRLAGSLPFPLSMAGVTATVNGVAAPLDFISDTQLNIQVPYETGAGQAVLGVNNNGHVASFVFSVSPAAPGIFVGSDGALVPFASAKRGDTLLAFITGEGEVSPALATGATPFIATPLNLLPQPRLPITVTVGGVTAPIAFAGIPSGLAGVTQINFVVPADAPLGPQTVTVSVGGVPSAPAKLNIAQ